ncbi:MAG TPA: DUF805 domain-containing protein [Steroidobacteraceae bacterium]|nr:DUF805 domain-containing protein [Steroidobacteraceae bacterium]
MGFGEAVKLCFRKYAQFEGRAARPEYWWFVLFTIVVGAATKILGDALYGVFALATLLPSIAVGVRRLHDTGRSGAWLLLWLIPVVGWFIVLIFEAERGVPDSNEYGAPPAA